MDAAVLAFFVVSWGFCSSVSSDFEILLLARIVPAPSKRKGILGKPGTNAIAAIMKDAILSGSLVLRNCLPRSCPTLFCEDIFVTRKPELTEIITEGINLSTTAEFLDWKPVRYCDSIRKGSIPTISGSTG